jgi:hypothetical protein
VSDSQMERLDELYGSLILDTTDLLHIEDKSFDEIVSSFDSIITKVFEDDNYHNSRWLVVKLFGQKLAERAGKIYAARLHKAFKDRLKFEAIQ